MHGLDDDSDAHRVEGLLDTVADLLGQALLDLQAAGVSLHHAGDLGKPGDAAVRDVGDMGLADKREHVVLAQGEQFDVLDQDHLAVRLREYGGTDDGLAALLIALRQELPGLRHALGRLDEPLALRVLAQQLENGFHMPCEFLRGFFVVFFDFPVCHGIVFVAPCDGKIWTAKLAKKIHSIVFLYIFAAPNARKALPGFPKRLINNQLKDNDMYWTLELASSLDDAPWPATKEELIDYATRTCAPDEVVENLEELEDDGEIYESIEDIWPDYPTKDDFFFNEEEY